MLKEYCLHLYDVYCVLCYYAHLYSRPFKGKKQPYRIQRMLHYKMVSDFRYKAV